MPSRTTKAPTTKATSNPTAAGKRLAAKGDTAKNASAAAANPVPAKRKTTGSTLAAAAASAGRKRSVKAAQTEQRTAAPVPNAAPGRLDPAERRRLVAEAAYYRAQHRDFAPGHELDDWLDAEAEIERHAPAR